MSLPNETELVDALLKSMHRIGRMASIEEQESEVIRLLGISADDSSIIHEGSRTKLNYRLAWSRTYLKSIGLLRRSDRGVWELTDRGRHYSSITELRNAGDDEYDDLFEDSTGIEGLDFESPHNFPDYPIDSVLIRQETRTLMDVVRRIEEKRFIMDPDFQRDFVWTIDKQSKLVESMLMRIPLPVFYLAEREDGLTVVVDGLQRLTTFKRFLKDEFELRGLVLGSELNGKKFSQLSPKLQNRLEDTQLILFLIDARVPEKVRLDIFERVNGGVPLSRQQMRNSIYSGQATRWLKAQVHTRAFKEATQESLDWRTMRDRECVNRFCAFSLLGTESYDGDMDFFLGRALKEMNQRTRTELDLLGNRLQASMNNNKEIFGRHAFRKHWKHSTRRSMINIAIFDVFSVLLSRVPEHQAICSSDRIKDIFFDLMNNAVFVDAISSSTNSKRKVESRFMLAQAALTSVLHDVQDAGN